MDTKACLLFLVKRSKIWNWFKTKKYLIILSLIMTRSSSFFLFLFISLHQAEEDDFMQINECEHLLLISSLCLHSAWSYSWDCDKSFGVHIRVSYNWLQRALYIHQRSKPEDPQSIRQNYTVKQGQGFCTTTNIKELLLSSYL